LRGLWQHPPYFHDGSAATPEAVVERYNERRNLRLSQQDMRDLAQFLRSL
jgi:cytochrome c peroxidase